MADDSRVDLAAQLAEARKEIDYYKRLAREAGNIRLRETEALSTLIGELRSAEEALRESEERYRALVGAIPDPMVVYDRQGKVTYINDAFTETFGWNREEVLGRIIDFVPPEEAQKTREGWERIFRGEEDLLETKRFTKNGDLLDVQLSPASLRDKDDNISEIIVIHRDITERKKAEEALERTLATAESLRHEAEVANRAKSQFLASMSHEIRTPLNGIIGMAELVLNTDLTAEQRKYLELLQISSDTLLGLINDILDFSKIEAGKLSLAKMEFSVRRTISERIRLLSLQADAKGLSLIHWISPDIPDRLVGDPGRLCQILTNVVANAIKFTGEGRIVVKGESRSLSHDEVDLHFSVKDTGVGISSEDQRRIFGAFEQADSTIMRTNGGTGLGLAISSALIQMMGGRIWVESEVGRGSTFHFTVRLGLPGQPAQVPKAAKAPDLKGMPVLVVGDNDTNRRMVQECLLLWGMKPTATEGGESALTAMETAFKEGRPFTLVLADRLMPGMDGFELAERIKENPDLVGTTIVILSSSGERGDAARCQELGISAYIPKPLIPSDLLQAISTALQGASPREEPPSLVTRYSIREGKKRLHVLLAEDNAVNREVAVNMLEKSGHMVTVAENGQEALSAFQRQPFDLIVMDVQMPVMDGCEATNAIRELEKSTGGRVPIIAVTAHALKGDKERFLEAGMDAYISKPLTSKVLLEAIDRVLSPEKTKPESHTKSPATDEVIDGNYLMDMLGGDMALMKRLVELYLQEYPKRLSEIRQAIADNDSVALQKAAHSLRGSVATFRAGAASNAALRLETRARSEDFTHTLDAVQELEEQLPILGEALVSIVEESDQ